jgi:hypothetical protein
VVEEDDSKKKAPPQGTVRPTLDVSLEQEPSPDTEPNVYEPSESSGESQGVNAQTGKNKRYRDPLQGLRLYYANRDLGEGLKAYYAKRRHRMTNFDITKRPTPYPVTNRSSLFYCRNYVVEPHLTHFLAWKGEESTSWWKALQGTCTYYRSPDGIIYRSKVDCFRAKYQYDLRPAGTSLVGNTTREDVLDELETNNLDSPVNSELDNFLNCHLDANGGRLGNADIAALEKECGL